MTAQEKYISLLSKTVVAESMFVAVCEEKNKKLEESERARKEVEGELEESQKKREEAEGRVEELVVVCEKDR